MEEGRLLNAGSFQSVCERLRKERVSLHALTVYKRKGKIRAGENCAKNALKCRFSIRDHRFIDKNCVDLRKVIKLKCERV